MKRYKVTIFFILTYWILNPILFWHFGNAYISTQNPSENRLLVFLAGPISFSEDITVNLSLMSALLKAALDPDFWVPFLTIIFLEWRVRDKFRIVNLKVGVLKSYSMGVIASYVLSILHFRLTGYPTTGTSVISFSLLLTYSVFYPLSAYCLHKQSDKKKDDRIVNAMTASLFGFVLVFSWLFSAYGAHIWNYAVIFSLTIAYLSLFPLVNNMIGSVVMNNRDSVVRGFLIFLLIFAVVLLLMQYIFINKNWPLHLLGFVFYVFVYVSFSYEKISEIRHLKSQQNS